MKIFHLYVINGPVCNKENIQFIKINLHPWILYFFNKLPIPVPKNYNIDKLQANILNFIWSDKMHCISKHALFAYQAQGGLTVPNLAHHYKAAQLHHAMEWAHYDPSTKWDKMELLQYKEKLLI